LKWFGSDEIRLIDEVDSIGFLNENARFISIKDGDAAAAAATAGNDATCALSKSLRDWKDGDFLSPFPPPPSFPFNGFSFQKSKLDSFNVGDDGDFCKLDNVLRERSKIIKSNKNNKKRKIPPTKKPMKAEPDRPVMGELNCDDEESLFPLISAVVAVVVVVDVDVDVADDTDAFKSSGGDGDDDETKSNSTFKEGWTDDEELDEELGEPVEVFVWAIDVVYDAPDVPVDDGEILFVSFSVCDEDDEVVIDERDVQETVEVAEFDENALPLGFGDVPTVEVEVAVPVAVRLGFEVEVDVIVIFDVIDGIPLCKALNVVTEVALTDADETVVTFPDSVDDPEAVDVDDTRGERVNVTWADVVKVLISVPVEKDDAEIDPVAEGLGVLVDDAHVVSVNVCTIVADAVAEQVPAATENVDKDDIDAAAVPIEDTVNVAEILISEVEVGVISEVTEGRLDGVAVSVLKALFWALLLANTFWDFDWYILGVEKMEGLEILVARLETDMTALPLPPKALIVLTGVCDMISLLVGNMIDRVIVCVGSPVGAEEGENGIENPERKAEAVAAAVSVDETLVVGVVLNDSVACETVATPERVVTSEDCAVNDTEDVDEDEPDSEDIKLSTAVRLKSVLWLFDAVLDGVELGDLVIEGEPVDERLKRAVFVDVAVGDAKLDTDDELLKELNFVTVTDADGKAVVVGDNVVLVVIVDVKVDERVIIELGEDEGCCFAVVWADKEAVVVKDSVKEVIGLSDPEAEGEIDETTLFEAIDIVADWDDSTLFEAMDIDADWVCDTLAEGVSVYV
jgi:hypothetical protein